MIKAEEMKRKKQELIEKVSGELANKSFEIIEKKVEASFYEYAETGRIYIEDEDFIRVANEIMKKVSISVDTSPKLYDEITRRAYNMIQEFIKEAGWKFGPELDCIDSATYILPLDTESKED